MSLKNGGHAPHRAIYDAFTIGSTSATNSPTPSTATRDDPFMIRPQTSSSTGTPKTISAWTEASMMQEPMKETVLDNIRLNKSLSSSTPTDFSRQSLIFSPPNCINDDDDRRPSTSWGNGGAPPTKAAGDVSLSRKQITPFLIKASLRLPPVKAEGVQIRLRELPEVIDQLSEQCINKLNYLVDDLDRGAFEEARGSFETMKKMFPVEMNSNWAKGIRLLIVELIPHQKSRRIGSAGSHVRNQSMIYN
ncbi:unnamed protein product [Caenorhabditis bovis]|uniref:Uncharacterized protein n=1 Tax=Caenorhabditis bovis TaxID=2654633 RepID=A0A8S1ENA9_9PELO|nr:unnamed protein product [Caenorhabditis bovis]